MVKAATQPKTRDKEKTKAAIKKVARSIVLNEGWKALTVSRVAKESGLSRQWIHQQFENRLTLAHAVMNETFSPWYFDQKKLLEAGGSIANVVGKSFDLMLSNSPLVPEGLIRLLGESEDAFDATVQQGQRQLLDIWGAYWKSQGLPRKQAETITIGLLWSMLGLVREVNRRTVSKKSAKQALVSRHTNLA